MAARTKSARIALLFEYATLNGGERSMLASLDWIRKHKTDLEFVAIAPGQGRLADAMASLGIEVIPWMMAAAEAAKPTGEEIEVALLQAVQSADPGLLHANSLAMGRLTGRIASRLPIPTTAHVRDILNLSRTAIADLNRNRRLIAVSQATREMHVSRGMDPDKVVVVRNGLDLEQFQPRPRQGVLRHDLQLTSAAILIATIGQIGLRKGQDVLAAAAPAIVRQFPQAHFLLIGERSSTKPESIQFEQSIKLRFEEQHLSSHLHCLGYRDDIPALLAEVDLIAHPANQEPFGRVLLEAAACGIPVVATDVGGTPEIVINGVTGLLVPPKNPDALAAAVIELLIDTDRLLSMRAAARLRATGEFDIARSADRLLRQWHDFGVPHDMTNCHP